MDIERKYIQAQWDKVKAGDSFSVKIVSSGPDNSEMLNTHWMTLSPDKAERIMAIVGEGDPDA
jgi:hypothetical protein